MDSCGLHKSERARLCTSKTVDSCPDEEQETGDCDLGFCECECLEFHEWTPWTNCDCDTEEHTRNRTCSVPKEAMCPNWQNINETETMACDSDVCCCTDWMSWGSWTDCSVTCGNGTNARQRLCRNPRNLTTCVDEEETGDCSMDHCDCPGCQCLDYSVYEEQRNDCLEICTSHHLNTTNECQVCYCSYFAANITLLNTSNLIQHHI